jgi:ketosteroid isomerase-like protein
MTSDNTAELAARVRAIEDRFEIQDLIVRYAQGVDRRDVALIASCFTDDAEASFAGVPSGIGGKAIAAFLGSMMPTGDAPPTMHLFTNIVVVLDGDRADVRSNAIVYGIRGEPEQVRLRGLGYNDSCVRTAAGWRIRKRVHSAAWEGAAESVPLTPIRPPTA